MTNKEDKSINGNDLSVQPTEVLLNELNTRFENCLFLGERKSFKNKNVTITTMKHKGTFSSGIGLCRLATIQLEQKHFQNRFNVSLDD